MVPIEVVRAVRTERLASIRAGRPILSLMDGAMVVLHCIPVRRDRYAINVDVGAATTEALVPLGYRSPQRRVFDFDGVLSTAPGPGGKVYGYAELRRNGIIEAVDTSLLRTTSYLPGAARFLPSAPLEGAIIVATRRFLQLEGSLGIQPPFAIGLSLLGVQGYYLALDDRYRMMDVHEIMHQDLLFSEVLIRNADEDPMTALKNTFDQLWNTVGMPACGDYNDTRALTIAMDTFA